MAGSEIDFRELTNQIEAGDGCVLKQPLSNLETFEERKDALQQIANLNKQDRLTDANVPELKLDRYDSGQTRSQWVMRFDANAPAGKNKSTVYNEQWKGYDVQQQCRNVSY